MTRERPTTCPLDHEVVVASAGTGKTFTLSLRYAALLMAGVPAARVVASTFTRKAAGEILARVVDRLVRASSTTEGASELAANLREAGIEAGGVSREESSVRVASFARALHEAGIGTMDAYTLRVLRAFAPDLGLAPGWRIADDDEDEALRLDALTRVVEEAEPSRMAAILSLLRGGRLTSAVIAPLLREVRAGHDVSIDSEPGAWDDARDEPRDGDDEGSVRDAAVALRAAALPATKKGAPDSNWTNAIAACLGAMERTDWLRVASAGPVRTMLEGGATYARQPIEGAMRVALERVAAIASARVRERHGAATRALRDLLGAFDEHYQRLKRRAGLLRFDDGARLLATPRDDGSALATPEEIAFRLDARFDHLLLDEFQDTSAMQFRMLLPMIDELASGSSPGRTFFCVGDPKQSLYQWRQAEPELLEAVVARWTHVARRELRRNWRSSPDVLGVVDRLFSGLATNPALGADGSPERRAGEAWADAYGSHEAARTELSGRVEIREAPAMPGRSEPALATLRDAIDAAEGFARRDASSSVGVLLRTGKHLSRVIHELRRRGVEASLEGGNPITDSRAVAAMLSMLHLADHPGDTAGAFHVASSPLGGVVGLASWDDAPAVSRVAGDVRATAARGGVGELIAAWAAALGDSLDDHDALRVEQLLGLARRFERRGDAGRLDDFVRYVRGARREDPRAARVRVMTIHASKGLEFDAVVLGDLDARIPAIAPTIVAARRSPLEPFARVTRYPSEAVRLCSADARGLYERYRQREVAQELGVLYVAMTRARRALSIHVSPAGASRDGTEGASGALSLAAILRAGLVEPGRTGAVLFESGAPAWPGPDQVSQRGPERQRERGPARSDDLAYPSAPEAPLVVRLAPARVRGRAMTGASPSAEAGGRRPIAIDSEPARRRGIVLHRWFQAIEWLDEGTLDGPFAGGPDDRSLERLAASVGGAFEARLAADFRQALRREGLRALLLRPRGASGARAEVRRELAFALAARDADGLEGVASGRMDRVVIERGPSGAAERATVVDFKTGARTGSTPDHAPQLRAYAHAVRTLYGLECGAARALVAWLDGTVEVIDIEGAA